jgi:adenine specific DNA methylase Mod
MPTLNWIGKEKIVNHDKDVPFRLMRKNKKFSLGKSENLIIEGDNLEALKALMPFYYGKIKCIYIDPPYNTGNEKWVYNDKVNSPKIKEWLGKIVGPEGEDLTRHDKWLCMMYPRLKLLRDLLRDNGVIFVSIDDTEHCYLKQILDDIFGPENFIANIIWQKKFSPQNDAKYFSDTHDFIVVYAKKRNSNGEKNGWIRNLLPRTDIMEERYSNSDNDPRGPWSSSDLSVKTYSKEYDYPIKTPSGKIIKPTRGRCWRTSKENLQKLIKGKRIWFGPNGSGVPRIKRFLSEVQAGLVPGTIWMHSEVGHNQEARQVLKEIFPEADFPFETPKPVRLIKRILQIATKKNDFILDSFAGSGTTGHAVLDLNKEDGGNRRFILIEMEKNIAKNITVERVKRVARGYSYKKNSGKTVKVTGLGDGFEYVELGEPLFDKDGTINKEVKFDELASYVYFTETHTNLEKNKIKGNYLGDFGDNHYFLLFNGIGKNILDRKILKEIKKIAGRKIIYADKCLLDDDILEKNQIVFKQIPYEVKIY